MSWRLELSRFIQGLPRFGELRLGVTYMRESSRA
jgi:hypothetical protein